MAFIFYIYVSAFCTEFVFSISFEYVTSYIYVHAHEIQSINNVIYACLHKPYIIITYINSYIIITYIRNLS